MCSARQSRGTPFTGRQAKHANGFLPNLLPLLASRFLFLTKESLSLENSQLLQATCCDPSLESVMCGHTLLLVLLPSESHEEPVFPHLIIAWAVCHSW